MFERAGLTHIEKGANRGSDWLRFKMVEALLKTAGIGHSQSHGTMRMPAFFAHFTQCASRLGSMCWLLCSWLSPFCRQ